ncbi:MAG: arylsulfatase [Bacteroidales bacterium]
MKKDLSFLITIAFTATIPFSCSQEKPEELPNIIIIFADDMGYGDVSGLNPEAKTSTPAIDEMAESGLVFTEAHASASVCTPSRYGLLTGRYAFRNRVKGGNVGGFSSSVFEPERKTMAHLLKKAGYTTAAVGKWHLGFDWTTLNEDETPRMDNVSSYSNVDYSQPISFGPNHYGFDYSFIHPASLDIPPYLFLRDNRAIDDQMVLSSDVYPIRLETTEYSWDKKHTEEGDIYWGKGVWWRNGEMAESFRIERCLGDIVEDGTNFIEKHISEQKKNPFFLYLPLTGPHTPWVPEDQFKGKSSVDTYGDFILTIDNVVKVINDKVKQLGIAENTMVIFATDNGGYWPEEEINLQQHESNYGRRGQKGDIWDGGHHIPMVITWPAKISEPQQYDQLVSLTDLYATFADLTGQVMDNESGEDSFSFLHVLDGDLSSPVRNSMIHNTSRRFFAIREGDWKYIDMLGSGGFTHPSFIDIEPGMAEGQLYNIKSDPLESNNLFFEHPDIVTELKQKIIATKESGYSRVMTE